MLTIFTATISITRKCSARINSGKTLLLTATAESRRENPAGEGVLTFDFLKQKGFSLEDELMMSRFLTVPDAEKKHELILFYIENVNQTKHKLSEFYKDDEATEIWKNLSKDLTERSLKAFEIQN